MRVIVLEVIVCCTCSLSLIQEFYISVLVPFLAVVLGEKFRPGSSRIPSSNYQNRRAPCNFQNTLEWVSSASCSEPERLCSYSKMLCPEQVVLCPCFGICPLRLPLHSTRVL